MRGGKGGRGGVREGGGWGKYTESKGGTNQPKLLFFGHHIVEPQAPPRLTLAFHHCAADSDMVQSSLRCYICM